jgi:general secretion pathway protein G
MTEENPNQADLRSRGRSAVRSAERGFTLLEVMIVLAIIGLIAGSIGVTVFKQYRTSRIQTAKINVTEISNATVQYMIENNACPTSMDELVSKGNMKKKIKDPWNQDFIFKCPGQGDGADILSVGPDKQEGTADDIKSWE